MDFIITKQRELFIRIIILLVVLGLCYAIYHNGKSLSCEKCILTIKNEQRHGGSNEELVSKQNFTISVQTIYNSFKDKEDCNYIFNSDYGFVYNGNK